MTDKQIRKMLLEVIEHLDYDHYKHFLSEFSEDIQEANLEMDDLIEIARRHIQSAKP